MKLLFYSSSAPKWWPYRVITNGLNVYDSTVSVIIDNGAWSYANTCLRRGNNIEYCYANTLPKPESWARRLLVIIRRLEAMYKDLEILVTLPDTPLCPRLSVKYSLEASRILRGYDLVVVVHFDAKTSLGEVLAELLRAEPKVVAIPLKFYGTRPGKNRRVPDYARQVMLAEAVYNVLKSQGFHGKIHGLGPALKPKHIARLTAYLDSIDTTSWTRPNTTVLYRLLGKRYSAKNERQRELFFAVALWRLRDVVYIPLSVLVRIEGILREHGVKVKA